MQSALVTTKRAGLDEIVGMMKKEEEAEGEVLGKESKVTSMSSILHKVS